MRDLALFDCLLAFMHIEKSRKREGNQTIEGSEKARWRDGNQTMRDQVTSLP